MSRNKPTAGNGAPGSAAPVEVAYNGATIATTNASAIFVAVGSGGRGRHRRTACANRWIKAPREGGGSLQGVTDIGKGDCDR